jgi:SAM-dependent methyltransferase
MSLYHYFSGGNREITVLDYVKYETWNEREGIIKFIEGSADKLLELFKENTFDIIFANRVFHHFVKESWEATLLSINDIMYQISAILKRDGLFFITDYFYDGRIFDTSASRIIYLLTSCKIPFFVSVFRKIESMSAGVGVFFLSRKMWEKIIEQNKFEVESFHAGHKLKRKWHKLVMYKILLLIKNCQEDIMFILKKSNSGHCA